MQDSQRGKWNNLTKKSKTEDKLEGEEEKQEEFPIKVKEIKYKRNFYRSFKMLVIKKSVLDKNKSNFNLMKKI